MLHWWEIDQTDLNRTNYEKTFSEAWFVKRMKGWNADPMDKDYRDYSIYLNETINKKCDSKESGNENETNKNIENHQGNDESA